MTDSFPRQYARTQRLTLGEPRDLTVTRDGSRVIFARSRGGADPVNCLWSADPTTGAESLLVDPAAAMSEIAVDDVDLPPEERARRERMREGAGGITGYAIDRDGARVTFSLAGQLFLADLADGGAATTRHLDVPGPVFDPHLSPDGDRIAYVRGRELWVTDLDAVASRLTGPAEGEPDTVSWGSADFVAAEEMNRYRGFWWSPDGATIATCRVDDAPVQVWHISNPAEPGSVPNAVRYPAAGTPNPEVSLHLCPVDGGDPIEVEWDRTAFEYLAKVDWNTHGLAITVLSRDQHDLEVRTVEPSTGATAVAFTDHDDAWVELVPGTCSLIADGTAVMCAERDGARRLLIGDRTVSPSDVQIRAVVDATADRVVATGNPLDDASVQHVYRWTSGDGFEAITDGLGVHAAAVGGETVVLRSATADEPGARWRLPGGGTLASHAERPLVRPNVRVMAHTASTPTTAVLLPHDHDGSPLPVLLDPYGGPHAQRVVRSHNAFCASQWFADQGFAVVVADGRGTPGRGTDYERAVLHDLATGVLDDQVTALHAAAERHPELDLDRVAIRGWSFGGYLSALAVLERPEVFHAAVAGAPVTEWRLYDTCYTERYLGDPNERPDVYDANSLLPLAPKLDRPLLLIHGLADDNVVAAHTLQLSQALLAAGRPHEVLPLVGVTHMTPQEIVAENLLLHQLDFLRRSFGEARGN
ncbi:MAG: prolyl oligopeptidase family serine peptidase [Ilumatobacteraceae bacterium]|nr:prolyl oligopeptidase family serine peptidase [Ilumatobacteraceae bacterium]